MFSVGYAFFIPEAKGASMYLQAMPASELRETAVAIQVWEGHLKGNKTNVERTLCMYATHGPSKSLPVGDNHILFRFTGFDWQKNIRKLLEQNNIHFSELRTFPMSRLGPLLKKKIHIAEDDPDILFALSSILEEAGYHVRAFSGGAQILDGSLSPADLFILDKQMPDVDGLEVCRYLRTQSATRDTPVILISAQAKKGTEALHAGASDYIEKPFEMHYLLNVISKYIRRNF